MKSDSLFIVMGVSGSGKTTIAQMLARATGGEVLDADDFHTPENKAQMHAGIPLTDEQRWPWLDRLNTALRAAATKNKPIYLACSALKQSYRDRLVIELPGARFIYLKSTFAFIHARLAQRKNHFMPASLLESQFATLEEPHDAIVLDISRTASQLLEDFRAAAKVPAQA